MVTTRDEQDKTPVGKAGWLARALALVAVVITAMLGALGTDLYSEVKHLLGIGGGDGERRDDLINEIVSDAATENYDLVGSIRPIAFRPAGKPSLLVHLRARDSEQGLPDELRVYEPTTEDRFRLAYRMRPIVDGGSRHRSPTSQPGLPPNAGPLAITVRSVGDINGVLGQEAVIDLSETIAKPVWPRPTYLTWDPVSRHYKLHALLSPDSTGYQSMRNVISRAYSSPGDAARQLIDHVYARPTRISDALDTHDAVTSFAVDDYVLKPDRVRDPRGDGPGELVLTAGYVVRAPTYTAADRIQILRWRVNLRRIPPTAKAVIWPPRIVAVDNPNLRPILRRE